MKKVLFATTALVASAGIASAQGVEISGAAEMGIAGGTAFGDELVFFQSIDDFFDMTGETDNGLTFGASIDLDDAGLGSQVDANNSFADYTVFISGNFGTITMGDTDGALDWAMQEVNLAGGSINDAETSHAGFNGNAFDGFNAKNGQVVRYDYSFGDFAFAVSVELDTAGGPDDPTFQIGAKYDADLGGVTVGVGLGYATVNTPGGSSSAVGVSLDAGFGNGFSAAVNYTSYDNVAFGLVGTDAHYAIGVGYTSGAIAVGVNYGMYETSTGFGADRDGFGLAVAYDLGGGAEVQFGYGSGTNAAGATADTYSLGIAMSF